MASPNLFVIGAMKAGTTTVYHYLQQHPQIFMSRVKAPQYFIQAPPGGWQLWTVPFYYVYRLARHASADTRRRAQ